ncbi:PD-(D/E)XK nuclease family protein [Streptomyces sp. NPDC088261]|uniref:PD-(D/E)XK nuclease family protein n=1 Tax=Streptomyces sp. NPDC088261 TaxID=3365851 RepID=UPI00382A27AB
MADWQVPSGVGGDGNLVRIRPSDIGAKSGKCAQRLALKVRPGVSRVDDGPVSRRTSKTSALSPLYAVLDLIEFDQVSLEEALSKWRHGAKRRPHPGLIQWTEHAVRGYLAAAAESVSLAPVSRQWARQCTDLEDGVPFVHEETVTGRRYEGDGIRELRIPRIKSVDRRTGDPAEGELAETALAAAVLADARPVLSSHWKPQQPLTLGRFTPAVHLRVVEIGCVDASRNVLFEGTPEEAYHRYVRAADARVRAVRSGGDYHPGQECGTCELVDVCPAVPSRPGFLGVDFPPAQRRSWSMTTARNYRTCPAQAYLRDLFLPRTEAADNTAATVRGQAVHKAIEDLHSRRPIRACASTDAPTTPERWQAGRWEVSGIQARLGTQMVGDHALVCPLHRLPGDAEVYPERSLVVHDPEADVVVVAKTDLLYRRTDSWYVRETKTTRSLDASDPLVTYPQLALALLLAHEGAVPGTTEGGTTGCRVELERLTGSGPVLTELDGDDGELLAQARRIVTDLATPWHADEEYVARPGKHCGTCPVSQWCPDRAGKSAE